MDFVFNCPGTGQVFETAAFRIMEDHGVVVGADGSRRLDARVQLEAPCPHCGQRHIYRADEMVCPFEERPKA